MNSLIRTRFVAAAALAVAGFGAATAAHARSDVFFSVGIQGPVYVEPSPVYVQPRAVYVQPRPVYVQPQPVYSQPPVYVQSQVYGYGDDDQRDRQEERARRYEEWRRWQWRQHHQHGWDNHDYNRGHEGYGRRWD